MCVSDREASRRGCGGPGTLVSNDLPLSRSVLTDHRINWPLQIPRQHSVVLPVSAPLSLPSLPKLPQLANRSIGCPLLTHAPIVVLGAEQPMKEYNRWSQAGVRASVARDIFRFVEIVGESERCE